MKSINCMYEVCQLYKDVNWKTQTIALFKGKLVMLMKKFKRFLSKCWFDKLALKPLKTIVPS